MNCANWYLKTQYYDLLFVSLQITSEVHSILNNITKHLSLELYPPLLLISNKSEEYGE